MSCYLSQATFKDTTFKALVEDPKNVPMSSEERPKPSEENCESSSSPLESSIACSLLSFRTMSPTRPLL